MTDLVPVCTNPTHPDTLHFDTGECQPCTCDQPCDMDDDWVCWNRNPAKPQSLRVATMQELESLIAADMPPGTSVYVEEKDRWFELVGKI